MSNALENHDIFAPGADSALIAVSDLRPAQSPPDAGAQGEAKSAAVNHSARTPPARSQRPAFQNRSIAGRKPDDYVFAPRESAFYRAETITIRSFPMQVAFKKSFQRSALALFETDMIVPIIAPTDDEARAIFHAVDSTTQKFSSWAAEETARIDNIMAVNGIKCEGEFSDPLIVPVRVYSPRLYEIIALFKVMDHLVFLKSILWVTGHMDELAYKRGTYEARVRMLRLARTLWEIHSGAIRELSNARRTAIEDANDARAKRAEMVLARIAERQTVEADQHRDVDMGQEELEVEMGTTVEAAEAAMDDEGKPAAKRAPKKSTKKATA